MGITKSLYEPLIRARLSILKLSASHDLEHLDLVLSLASRLQAAYGGDLDVVAAAVLLHDLGRSDPLHRGAESAAESAKRAEAILKDIDFPEHKVPYVLGAIKEHDQPDLQPSTLEGRILKDADFLSGFGAVGIARSAIWTGETGGHMSDLLNRLERKMPHRLASLTFAQSRYQAMPEHLYVRSFIDRLRNPLSHMPAPPAPYVVIEGISGSGKSTQLAMLDKRYREAGYMPVAFSEPTLWYRQMRSILRTEKSDSVTQLLLHVLDRHLNVRKMVESAAASGNPTISDRSYLSSMVYQSGEEWLSPSYVASLHAMLPQPTHIFILDASPKEALSRIQARAELSSQPLGEHETLEQLTKHREGFLSLASYFPLAQIIDTQSLTPGEVHDLIWVHAVTYNSSHPNRGA